MSTRPTFHASACCLYFTLFISILVLLFFTTFIAITAMTSSIGFMYKCTNTYNQQTETNHCMLQFITVSCGWMMHIFIYFNFNSNLNKKYIRINCFFSSFKIPKMEIVCTGNKFSLHPNCITILVLREPEHSYISQMPIFINYLFYNE